MLEVAQYAAAVGSVSAHSPVAVSPQGVRRLGIDGCIGVNFRNLKGIAFEGRCDIEANAAS